ncbi:MAG: hypothetical protein IPM46_00890 [Flavobacteriales bacterium]|nr:hypothetical protein [Flavobacteriales bacterium]
MARFLKKIMWLTLALIASAYLLDLAFTAVFQRGRTVKAQWLHGMHDQRYDVVILGASRAWWNIDGTSIDTVCGVRSLNLANNHGTILEALHSLELFLAQGNTTGLALYQMDLNRMDRDRGMLSKSAYDHLPFLDDSLTYAHLSAHSSEWAAYRYVPFYRYAKFNHRWGLEELLVSGLGLNRSVFDSTGSHFRDRAFSGPETYRPENRHYNLNPDVLLLRDLCRRKGIRLKLFMAPYLSLRLAPGVLPQVKETLHANGFEFHDMSNRLPNKRYFYDNVHLNGEGGRRFTRMLIDEVVCP